MAEAATARRSTLGGTVSVPPGGTDAPMAVSPVPSIMMPSPPPMFHPVTADRARPTWASCAAIFDNIVAWLTARAKLSIAARIGLQSADDRRYYVRIPPARLDGGR